jgi:DNA-binding winged helix-turn-helix (wHTH) protein
MMPNPVFHFFDFRLDPARRELVRGETLIELSSRAFDCLVYLVQHRERAVGRDELISAVWGRADVSDNMLSQTLLRVRRALGENNPEHSAIRTVTKFGYRWVAPTQNARTVEVEAVSTPANDTMVHADVAAAPPPEAHAATAASDPAPANDIETEDDAIAEMSAPRASSTENTTADAVSLAVAPPQPSPTAPARRNPLPGIALVAAAALALLAATVFALRHRHAPPVLAPIAAESAAEVDLHALTLVLPVEVHADASWDWLRFGLMDLIANRLREGGVSTLDTRTLYTLLASHPDIAQARADAERELPALSHQRIYVRATLDNGQWQVQLTSVEAQRRLEASGSAADITASARQAADRLLLALGRTPPASAAASNTVQGLLQRTEAVLLSQRRESALELIEQAPPDVREDAAIRLRQAQLELKVGRFDAARARRRCCRNSVLMITRSNACAR